MFLCEGHNEFLFSRCCTRDDPSTCFQAGSMHSPPSLRSLRPAPTWAPASPPSSPASPPPPTPSPPLPPTALHEGGGWWWWEHGSIDGCSYNPPLDGHRGLQVEHLFELLVVALNSGFGFLSFIWNHGFLSQGLSLFVHNT